MKLKSVLTSTFSLALVALLVLTSATPKKGDYDWIKPRLDAAKAYTIEVIKAMPEDKYDYRPTDEVRSFKEQAYHIVYSIDYFNRVFKSNGQAQWNSGPEDSKNKAELTQWANEQFDAIAETILAAPNNGQLTAGIISYLDHNAHHRGQMVTYLRMNGIVPPSYR